ncbi:hypothetical protein CEF21_02755 [Bacillus sp. FJAT-42376]|uniref:DUF6526 family protein n=1 Tax=Bacillus sp. FJAT-42376 TaxID=2014076 RepID=UPI000F4EC68D|nr:DUF6526 family protein [Bacillus sp. FJAT-42376]AZB41319.1 hypothetical protein CEF21_02755 [Bacillus sp. FJAT-42376]
MENQNYSNHTRMHPLYHYVLSVLILALLVISIVYATGSLMEGVNLLPAIFMVLAAVCLILFYILVRIYPLKAQDRAIRAEENLRHFALTGKLLNPVLTTGQIVALRFASDEELPGLAQRAAENNLPPKKIKESIQNWKADHYRI